MRCLELVFLLVIHIAIAVSRHVAEPISLLKHPLSFEDTDGSTNNFSTTKRSQIEKRWISPPKPMNFEGHNDLKEQLRVAFEDALTIAQVLVTADYDGPLWDRYLRNDPLLKNLAKGAFQQMLGEDGIGNSNFTTDVTYWKSPKGAAYYDDCMKFPATCFAFTISDGKPPGQGLSLPKGKAQITFCDSVFHWPSLSAIKCGDLDDFVSVQMASLGSTMMHEWFHWTALVNPEGKPLKDQLKDVRGLPGAPRLNPYGPYNVLQLRKDPKLAEYMNVENYMWFALDTYWTKTCGKSFDPAPKSQECLPDDIALKCFGSAGLLHNKPVT